MRLVIKLAPSGRGCPDDREFYDVVAQAMENVCVSCGNQAVAGAKAVTKQLLVVGACELIPSDLRQVRRTAGDANFKTDQETSTAIR